MKIIFMKLFLFIIIAMSLIGCSHSVLLPGSYRQKPKTAEKQWGGEVNFGFQQTVEVEVFDDYKADPPVRTDGSAISILDVVMPVLPFFDVNLGILKDLDVYYTSGLGLRYQWLGDAKSTGWNSTVFVGGAGFGTGSNSKTEDDAGYSAETKTAGLEYGISAGYYWTGTNGLYLTYGMTDGKSKTDITHPTKTFEYNDKFEHSMVSLGGTYGETWYFWLEVSSITTKWKFDEGGSNTQENSGFLIGTGYRW